MKNLLYFITFFIVLSLFITKPLFCYNFGVPEWINGFTKYNGNPVMVPTGHSFDKDLVFNPGVIFDNGGIYMLYRAINYDEVPTDGTWATSRIGLAISGDGINFERYETNPVIFPEFDYEIQGGCEDPRLMKIADTYYVTYTGYSPRGTPSCLASSKNLLNWEKYGPIVPFKSAAILNVPINGKYWLYYGDTNIWAAYSKDLINWEIVEEPVLQTRPGYFDEELCEPGPPPILTEDGIVLIYNGNIPKHRAELLEKGKIREYATGWAIFDVNDPTKVIARSDEPFLKPTAPYERIGEVDDVVFSEGLVKKDGKSYLYYGSADAFIGVAISDKTWQEPLFASTYPGVKKINRSILEPHGSSFEHLRVYNPTVISEKEENGKDRLYMIYRAEGKNNGTGVLCLASSMDGMNFIRHAENPIVKPDSEFDINGCEDPRIVKFKDTYYLFYDGNDSGINAGNICLATSRDLIKWEKYGEVLQAKHEWEKKQIKAPAPVPIKINGKYWMYYQGEKEAWKTKIGIASSDDLIHWKQAESKPVLEPRKGYFDSTGTEPGTSIVLDEGIFLVYNGWSDDTINKIGWALFSKDDPGKLLKRCKEPIISYPNDHVFAEGLTQFNGEYIIYYGVADKWIEGAILNMEELISSVLD